MKPTAVGSTAFTVTRSTPPVRQHRSTTPSTVVARSLGDFTGSGDVGTPAARLRLLRDSIYTVAAGKGDIGGKTDAIPVHHRPLTGDGRLTTQSSPRIPMTRTPRRA